MGQYRCRLNLLHRIRTLNIFVTDPSPTTSARHLPDKHIVKMPLETCQMLSIVCSDKWGHSYGDLHRLDGQAYKTEKGAFRNHPCTVWANDCLENTWWLLAHGPLCNEYEHRYGKNHSCEKTLIEATTIIPSAPSPYRPSSLHLQSLTSSSTIQVLISSLHTNVMLHLNLGLLPTIFVTHHVNQSGYETRTI